MKKLWFLERFTWKRFFMSLVGTVLLAPTIALLRKAELGIDPWNGFVLNAARLFRADYLTLYPILIGILLVIVFFVSKHLIGIATILNLSLIGFLTDGCMVILDKLFTVSVFWHQIALLIASLLILCIASSLYITADLGVSSYDAMALIASEKTSLQFRWCRVGTDLSCVLLSVVCTLIVIRRDGADNIRNILDFLRFARIGTATIITALFMGPVTQFCCRYIAIPILGESGEVR